MALLDVVKQLDPSLVTHGFRSTFSDWARDTTSFQRDIIEAALGHAISNQTEAAYRRKDALEKRRLLIDAWASYCQGSGSTSKVVPIRA